LRNFILIANEVSTWQEAEPFRLRAEAEYSIAIKKCIKDRNLENLKSLVDIKKDLNLLEMRRLKGCVSALEKLEWNLGWYWEVALGLGESLDVDGSKKEESRIVEDEIQENDNQGGSSSTDQTPRR
jgi:hypothetical protein